MVGLVVRLKGIKRTTKVLADGTRKEFFYLRATGAPITGGPPGSPEFMKSYNEALTKMRAAPVGVYMTLITKFKASSEFKDLAAKTKKDYARYIRTIEERFGDLPIAALEDRRVRGVFLEWRDELSDNKRNADYAWSVNSRILSWAKDRSHIEHNHCAKAGRLYKSGGRAEIIWETLDLRKLFGAASREVIAAVMLALWTGQRQGDVLRLPWSAYDGHALKVRQGKTDAYVRVPVGPSIKAVLDSLPRTSTTILTNTRGRSWTEDGFRTSFWKACDKVDIREDLHFHDLRGTACTRLALAGCTVPEIASLTGHSMKTVEEILSKHYLGGRVELAEAAMAKMEATYGCAAPLLIEGGRPGP